MAKIRRNLALSDSGFVFNPSSGDSYTANPIGMEIIRHLKDDLNEREITALICKRYRVDKATFEKDFREFVKTLSNLKLTDGG